MEISVLAIFLCGLFTGYVFGRFVRIRKARAELITELRKRVK